MAIVGRSGWEQQGTTRNNKLGVLGNAARVSRDLRPTGAHRGITWIAWTSWLRWPPACHRIRRLSADRDRYCEPRDELFDSTCEANWELILTFSPILDGSAHVTAGNGAFAVVDSLRLDDAEGNKLVLRLRYDVIARNAAGNEAVEQNTGV